MFGRALLDIAVRLTGNTQLKVFDNRDQAMAFVMTVIAQETADSSASKASSMKS